jgi:hypothetical protein
VPPLVEEVVVLVVLSLVAPVLAGSEQLAARVKTAASEARRPKRRPGGVDVKVVRRVWRDIGDSVRGDRSASICDRVARANTVGGLGVS